MSRYLNFTRLVALLVVAMSASATQMPDEVSGIARLGEQFYLVDDNVPGTVFTYRISEGKKTMPISDPDRLRTVAHQRGAFAVDLEGVGFLSDGRLVALSERLRQVVDIKAGVMVAQLPEWTAEFGNRGLEGLAVRASQGGSEVAVLYEGGYAEAADEPIWLPQRLQRVPLVPFIVTFEVPSGGSVGIVEKQREDAVLLDLKGLHRAFVDPVSGDREPFAQRFRAPDLVWHQDGFIVLLSSENRPLNGTPGLPCQKDDRHSKRYSFKLLQRFARDGSPIGDPINLDKDPSVIGAGMAGPCRSNWEGLGWFQAGKRLMIVNDHFPRGQTEVVVIDLPRAWQ
ncbi:MAG: hypothetical protein O2780_10275 [Proteobacteria bacterium]|nr:hypothetical protein [Pseudomonadota bacterium]